MLFVSARAAAPNWSKDGVRIGAVPTEGSEPSSITTVPRRSKAGTPKSITRDGLAPGPQPPGPQSHGVHVGP